MSIGFEFSMVTAWKSLRLPGVDRQRPRDVFCFSWLLLSLGGALSFSAVASDWPGWRGISGTGVATEVDPPLHWSTNSNIRWRTALPAPGMASPIVWSNRVFITQATDNTAALLCFSREEGKLIWSSGFIDVAFGSVVKEPSSCSATPATDGEHIYAFFGSRLACFDNRGQEVWVADLEDGNSPPGIEASPVLAGNLCIIAVDSLGRLAAFDKASGNRVWEVTPSQFSRSLASDIPQGVFHAKSTPLLIEREGNQVLISAAPNTLSAIDAGTGKPIWICDGLGGTVHATPMWDDDVLVAISGFPDGCAMAVNLAEGASLSGKRTLWPNEPRRGCVGSGVLCSNLLFTLSEDGIAACMQVSTGTELWEHQLRGPNSDAGSWSSILSAGDRLYLPNKSGDVFVLRASPRLEILATNSVFETTRASLAAAGDDLFLRTDKALWCLSEKNSHPKQTAGRRQAAESISVCEADSPKRH